MPNYGFLIDQSKCIGCHACTVACKSENQVPVGVNRTWVKYVETGAYPDVRRRFQVTRCNHCANPPCVRICPVSAMFQRTDGIVEFDPSICIGCKSCMQACPYDSIYLDPETNTAAKCNFCAHRIDVGLEPACVVVCPEHAILAGDLDDPAAEISRKLSGAQATVRKPEQGTAPKLFYINGNDWSLHPTASPVGESYMWADKITEQNVSSYERGAFSLPVLTSKSGAAIRTPQPQGSPLNGPIQIGGRVAEHMVQTAYNAQHKIHWHWELASYIVTKNIAGGLFMLLSLQALFNPSGFSPASFLAAGFTALVFMLLTVLLLIKDLAQPKRFFYLLLRPQWKSWLTRGAFILIGFTAAAGLWWLIEAASYWGLASHVMASGVRPLAAILTFPLALFTAIYTAFLLGQAEGRDMWQSPLLPFQLAAQSFMVASGAFLVLSSVVSVPPDLHQLLSAVFPASIGVHLLLVLAGNFNSFASEVALLGFREMTQGRLRRLFWLGGIVLGHLIPLALVLTPLAFTLPIALACGIVGLFLYEYAFVLAPQRIPNS
jgi:Fe-S-cluster-containing dehydrogenase component/formate-dependent nitrite reductase membrane component NrfD